jgi:hypothetical protein
MSNQSKQKTGKHESGCLDVKMNRRANRVSEKPERDYKKGRRFEAREWGVV